MADGSKKIMRDIINAWKIKRDASPAYIVFLLEKLFNVLEDVYSVGSATELQEAIDEIGSDAGSIFIEADTFVINTTIDIDGGGSYVIYGHGDNTILQPADGVSVFNVTNSASVLFRTFKIDTSNYTADTQAFVINEANNNLIGFEDITILGGGTVGVGIELQSNNCAINNCNITNLKTGIYVNNSQKHDIIYNTLSSNSNYGLYMNIGDYCGITGNTCTSNTLYGIYLYDSDYNVLSNNTCNSNSTGIYINTSAYNTLSSNATLTNTENGIYITDTNYSTISSNTVSNNDSNSASNTAGIYITTNSDYNTITANSVNNNNNSGAGNAYGILIATNDCNENVISANNANGNDIDYEDEGTDTTVVYYIQNQDELQDAIDSIGTGTGKIIITSGSISITTTITIDGGGSYIIEGQGDNTILLPSTDGVQVFKITNAKSCRISDLKIDMTAYTTSLGDDNYPIWVNEGSDNQCIIERCTLTGDGTNGVGILVQSNNSIVRNCKATSIGYGIIVSGSYNSFESNLAYSCSVDGLNVTGDYNNFSGNIAYGNSNHGIYISGASNSCVSNTSYNHSAAGKAGIYIDSGNKNTVTGNTCYGNAYGIYLSGDNCTITGNTLVGNSSVGIYINSSAYSTISGNNCSSLTTVGYGMQCIALINSIISGNNCSDISGSAAGNGAGIYLDSTSDNNTILSNNITDNTNSGAGTGYGIIIDAGCDNNEIRGNRITGNDVNILDNGDNNQIEYLCSTGQEIQDAVDSIGTKSAIIKIKTGIISISTTIDLDGGGAYIIEGDGDDTILTTSGDITLFNITSTTRTTLKNFKIDANSLVTATKEIITINEGSNNMISCNNITITGDSTNGYGIETNSNNCRIENCNIDNITVGINILSTNNILRGNVVTSCASYGISIGGNNNTISSNNSNTNVIGFYINSDYNLMNGNYITSNTQNGIYLTGSDYNAISNNYCIGNDSNTANPQAGIYIDVDSNNNTIIGNTSINNNNSGAGTGYGIYIGNANCDENIIDKNNCSGNDIQYWDLGTNSQIVYICSTGQDIQYAIDSIAAKAGIIKITIGTINISTQIDIDGNGTYIIEGDGDGTILTTVGDITLFNITAAKTGTILRNFKIDANSLTTATKPVLYVNEGSNNTISIMKIHVTGDSSNGHGIDINTNNNNIKQCLCDNLLIGINNNGDNNIITENICTSNYYYGIYNNGSNLTIINNICSTTAADGIYINSDYSIIKGNTCTGNQTGIVGAGNDNTIVGNACNNNTTFYGISITGNYNNIVGNTCNDNDTNNALDRGGIRIGGDYNNITGNIICNNNNTGAGTGYAIIIDGTADNTLVAGNQMIGNDDTIDNSGTNTKIYGDDTAFAVSWNGNLGTPTKNVVYDEMIQKLENIVEDTTPQLGGDLDLNGNNIDFPSTPNISDVKDEDNMASNSATMLATQQSIKAYVDNAVAGAGGDKTNYIISPSLLGAGATGATGEVTVGINASQHVKYNFMIPSNTDESEDVYIIFPTYRTDANNDTVEFVHDISTRKLDGSETASLNVENGVSYYILQATQNRYISYTYTLSSGDYEAGDLLLIDLEMDEYGRQFTFYPALLVYEEA